MTSGTKKLEIALEAKRGAVAKKTVTKKSAPRNLVTKKPLVNNTGTSGRETLASLRAHVDNIEKRLRRADSLTKSSIKALSLSFERLQSSNTNEEALSSHVHALSERLNGMITQTRKDVAHDLQAVMEDPRFETLCSALTKANKRLTTAETQQAEAINVINSQIAELAVAVDKRMQREKQAREAAVEVLSKRLNSVEHSSGEAITMIGEKIATATQLLNERSQASAEQALGLQKKLEEHKSEIGQRIEALEDDQRNTAPSIERRLVTLSTRLETLEAGSAAYDGSGNAGQTLPLASGPLAPGFEPPEYAQSGEVLQYAQPGNVQDAFSPLEAIQTQSVPNPYEAGCASAPETTEGGLTEGQKQPQEFVLQEYVPQTYDRAANSDLSYDNPYATRQSGHQNATMQDPQAPQPFQAPLCEQTRPLDNVGLMSSNMTVPVGGSVNLMADAPPPMSATVMPAMTRETMGQKTMDIARPGADVNQKKKKRKFRFGKGVKKSSSGVGDNSGDNKSSKKPKNPPIKIAALIAGVAVVAVLSAKTILPKEKGVLAKREIENATPTIALMLSNTEPMQQTAPRGVEGDVINNVPSVGTAAFDTMPAPDIRVQTNGQTNTQTLTLQAAAKNGESIAQFQLGLIRLEAGKDEEAVRLIRLAANQGQAAAQYRLAKLYEAGIGVKRDLNTARDLIERAAKGGNRLAMHDLGHFYTANTDIKARDVVKAVQWFEQAAQRGVIDSQYNLGVLYNGTQGIPQDLSKSYIWYKIAARQGDVMAAQASKPVARELSPEQISAADAQIKAFTPKQINSAANGIFKNLPWTSAKKTKSMANVSVNAPVNVPVQKVQKLLSNLGYGVGAPDGTMGPKTRNAIIKFERANGLPETGHVDATLIEHLSLAAGV
ncbi:MAG: peptidoglycan-binding protein [Robiginitomaculum sp.]